MMQHKRLALMLLLLAMLLIPQLAYADGGKHVVAPGENLFRIALRYGLSVEALASANGITDTSQVFVGQVLIIPSGGEQAAAQPANPQPQPAAQPALTSPVYHTVVAGDTLNNIARRYNVTWQAILQANGLANANYIMVGQRLLIPMPGAPAAPQPAQVAAPTAAPAVAVATGSGRTHVVKRGEGLAQIATQYGLNWQQIASYNGIANANLIFAGMVLKIPDKGYNGGPAVASSSGPGAPQSEGKSILVILSQQRVYVYNNGELVRNVLVSTGLPGTPTVTGNYKIYVKYRAQTMYGPGYYLPSVPYVMYFYQGYGLHGTYWHNNFGRPMSHGCVNMPTPEAGWLYNYVEVGTPVYVRY